MRSDRLSWRQLLFAALARGLTRLDALLGHRRAVQEAVALIAGLDDVAVMRQPIEQGGRHLGVAEHARPLGEVQVCRDHYAGVLVEAAEQMEQQRSAGLAERQVAELV